MDNNKSLIRSCLISAKNGLSLRQLESDFSVLVGGVIPYRENGFSTLSDYLRSMPDVVRFSGVGGSVTVHYVADASTAKIASLVQRQKTAKKKAKPLRLPRSVGRGTVKRLGTGTLRAPFANPASQRVRNVRPVASRSHPAPPTARISSGAPVRARQNTTTASAFVSSQPRSSSYASAAAPKANSASATASSVRQASSAYAAASPAHRANSAAATAGNRSVSAAVKVATDTVNNDQLAKMTPEKRFEYLRSQLNLPVETANTVPVKHGRYLCNLSVGDISVLTYPNDFATKEQAVRAAYEIAAKKLELMYSTQTQQVPTVADNDVIITRIVELLSDRPNGLWMTSVVDQYSAKFGSALPDNWQDTAFESGRVRFDRALGLDLYILYLETGGSPTSPAAVDEPVTPTAEPLLTPVELPAEQCFPVLITCVLDDAKLSMIIIGEDYNEKLDQLLTEMELTALDGVSPVTPSVGKIYMTLVDGKSPHRVQVISIMDTMVSAYFVDLGDTELLPLDQLYQLSPRFLQLPSQAVPAQLSGVSVQMPGSRHIVANHLLNKSFMCQVVSHSEKSMEVVLFDTANEEDINMNQLIEMQLQTIDEPQLPEKHGFADVFVVHIDCDEALLYVQLDDTTVTELFQLVNNAAESGSAINSCLSADQLVLAQYEDDWFRARVLSTSNDGQVDVLFIDYGNSSTVEMNQLRHLPSHLRCPPQCIPVRLSGLATENGGFSHQVAEQLELLLPGDSTRVLLKVVSRPDNEPAEVELFKRSADGSIVAVNTTLAVFCRELNYTNKKSSISRGSSGRVSTVDRSSSATGSESGGTEAGGGAVHAPPSPPPSAGSISRQSSVVGAVRLSSPFSIGTFPTPLTTTASSSCPRKNGQDEEGRVSVSPTVTLHQLSRPVSKQSPAIGITVDHGKNGYSLPSAVESEQLQLQQLCVDQLVDSEGYMDVIVSYCSNPWNIYIQPYRQLAALRSLMKSLQQYYNHSSTLKPMQCTAIIPGCVYAIQHHDKLWYRARVTNVVPEGRSTGESGDTGTSLQAIVYFVDFGDFSRVPLSGDNGNEGGASTCRVQLLPGWLLGGLPAQAVKARLAGVGPVQGAWQSDDCVYFGRLVNARPLVARVLNSSCVDVISGERVVLVQLVDTGGATEHYIHRLLVEAGHAVDKAIDSHPNPARPFTQFR